MDLKELYASTPEDQHGTIAVSADAISITKADQSVVTLIKDTAEDSAQLKDIDGSSLVVADPETICARASTVKNLESIVKK